MAKHSTPTPHGGIGQEQVVLSVDLKEGDRREHYISTGWAKLNCHQYGKDLEGCECSYEQRACKQNRSCDDNEGHMFGR